MVNQKKILLVNPSCLDKRPADEDDHIVPIGLYYIGALLVENGFPTKIINLADRKNNPVHAFETAIAEKKPDIIGFSVTNPTRWNAMECATAARKSIPDVTLVFGGPAPTFLCDHLFKACPDIDFIVIGEGEITFLELVRELEEKSNGAFEKINGLAFKDGNSLLKTPPRKPVETLDTLVHPSKYFVYQHLALSRGCPGRCSFCGSPKFWGTAKIRFHSPQWFVQELQHLEKKGVSHFYISDDTFTMDKKRVLEVCRLICDSRLEITWTAISRVDTIDKDILFSMRSAGCIQISFGVESGSKKIRTLLGKPIPREKILAAFAQTASYGILPRAYFIYGSPQETEKTIQDSIDLLTAIKPLSAIFYMLVIFPGTYLYQSAKKKGLVTDDIWYQKIEDLPWFEIDDSLDFTKVKAFGHRLRTEFYTRLDTFAQDLVLADIKELYPWHADFLSRLALTFSHGEYAGDPRIKNQDKTAKQLYDKALSYAPDARAFLGLALLFQKKKQFDDAVLMLEKGLDHFPENKNLNICMGINLMNKKQFNDALNCFEKFKTLPEARDYITICHKKKDEYNHDRKK